MDTSLEGIDVGLSETLSVTTESIPDTGLVETAGLPRGYSHKTTESGQLSLF
jgi:hypothetical protein